MGVDILRRGVWLFVPNGISKQKQRLKANDEPNDVGSISANSSVFQSLIDTLEVT